MANKITFFPFAREHGGIISALNEAYDVHKERIHPASEHVYVYDISKFIPDTWDVKDTFQKAFFVPIDSPSFEDSVPWIGQTHFGKGFVQLSEMGIILSDVVAERLDLKEETNIYDPRRHMYSLNPYVFKNYEHFLPEVQTIIDSGIRTCKQL